MKLLDKKTINEKRSTERKLDVDEGVKLAKTIDTLRETVLKEQVNLSQFRTESLKIIKRDIETLSTEKNSLENEVLFLKEQKKILLEIPMQDEWKEIEDTREQLRNTLISIEEREEELRRKEISILQREKHVELEKEKIAEDKMRNEINLKDSEERKTVADYMLSEVEKKKMLYDKQIEQRMKECLTKESEVIYREIDLENKLKSYELKEKQLDEKERGVNDKYETLLRTQNRLQKK